MADETANLLFLCPGGIGDPLVVARDIFDEDGIAGCADDTYLAIAFGNALKAPLNRRPVLGDVFSRACAGDQVKALGLIRTFAAQDAILIAKITETEEPDTNQSNARLSREPANGGDENVTCAVLASHLCSQGKKGFGQQ